MALGGPNRLWGSLPVPIKLSGRQPGSSQWCIAGGPGTAGINWNNKLTLMQGKFYSLRTVKQCHSLPRGDCVVFILEKLMKTKAAGFLSFPFHWQASFDFDTVLCLLGNLLLRSYNIWWDKRGNVTVWNKICQLGTVKPLPGFAYVNSVNAWVSSSFYRYMFLKNVVANPLWSLSQRK